MMGLASLPRNDDGFLDKRKIYNLAGQANIPIDSLHDIYPWEFVYYVEGYFEGQRQLYENVGYAVYSGVGQCFSKGKYKNIFEKQENRPVEKSEPVSKEGQRLTFDKLQELFGISIDKQVDDTSDNSTEGD